jgi:hypothetical protein
MDFEPPFAPMTDLYRLIQGSSRHNRFNETRMAKMDSSAWKAYGQVDPELETIRL